VISTPNDNSFLEKIGNFLLLRVKIGPKLLFGRGDRQTFKTRELKRKHFSGRAFVPRPRDYQNPLPPRYYPPAIDHRIIGGSNQKP